MASSVSWCQQSVGYRSALKRASLLVEEGDFGANPSAVNILFVADDFLVVDIKRVEK